MEINHTLLLDLQQIGTRQMMQAKQGDSLTRVAKLCLYDGGTEFDVPSGATLQIAYAKADGRAACMIKCRTIPSPVHPPATSSRQSCTLRCSPSQGSYPVSCAS